MCSDINNNNDNIAISTEQEINDEAQRSVSKLGYQQIICKKKRWRNKSEYIEGYLKANL